MKEKNEMREVSSPILIEHRKRLIKKYAQERGIEENALSEDQMKEIREKEEYKNPSIKKIEG